jgi:hypothetical protein
MGTPIGTLTSHFLIEVADVSPPEARAYLMAAVQAYNAMATCSFALSGEPPALDRDADQLEQRALVLMAIRIWLNQNARKYSLMAIKHSNVAGTTNLTGIEFALAKRVREMLEQELGPLLKRLTNDGVIAGTGVEGLDWAVGSAGILVGPGVGEMANVGWAGPWR